MRAAALRRALVTTPEPPCTKFACTYVARCALGLACEAFSVYVDHGRAPAPHMQRTSARRLELRPGVCAPTRAIFAELFGDAQRKPERAA